ncbi:hypothetical protein AHAS_Ahas02G0109500 [Arachis hypogaea]
MERHMEEKKENQTLNSTSSAGVNKERGEKPTQISLLKEIASLSVHEDNAQVDKDNEEVLSVMGKAAATP